MNRTSLILSIVTFILFSIILINSSCKKDEDDNSKPAVGGGVTGEPCPGIPTFTYQGQTYNTVLIGTQCWMKENLNVGTRINGSQEQTNNGTIEKYCYDDNETNCDEYGGLYQWDEMMQYVRNEGIQGICPDGWHVPSDAEWKILEATVDTQYGAGNSEWDDGGWRGHDIGKRLKTVKGWTQNTGTDAYGFSALPGGYRYDDGFFYSIGDYASFWSSTEINDYGAWHRVLHYGHDEGSRINNVKNRGFSLRCVKD